MAPQNSPDDVATEYFADGSIKIGEMFAAPSQGDEIVISGLSGKYPDSEDVYHFRDNLMSKTDMVSGDTRRWEPGHPEIPQRTGKLFNITKFDAGYFGVHHRQADQSDPSVRLLLETTMMAIFDAGIHPAELEGTNTGVFIGSCFSESEKTWFIDKLLPQGFQITGCSRAMFANRISYYLKLQGPSMVCDTACSSSLYAFEQAYRAIRSGVCDRAIVGGANLCLHPFVSLQFARLGVLSMDGSCKVFDKNGNGYARSETVSAVILQKSKDAKRIYATIVHAKTNCDGFKNSGITYPSGEMQIRLLREFYEECKPFAKPTDLSYLEAHGTGTKVGDPEELQAIEEIFLKDRPSPLLIGSVKSNIGHSEPSSGLCSITKVIIAFETGLIPPNIRYSEPRPESKALVQGRLRVVTEPTPLKEDTALIGINSFGFGGGNCHILLRRPAKKNLGNIKDDLPRLVCVTGRTQEAIDFLVDDVAENGFNIEHIRLLQGIFKRNVVGHGYKGFILGSKSNIIAKSFKYLGKVSPGLILGFGNVDGVFKRDIKQLLQSPVVANTVQNLQKLLTSQKINVLDVLQDHGTTAKMILSNFFVQIIIADLLKAIKISPEKLFGINQGLSLGTLIAAYFDGVLSLKKAVNCALAIAEYASYNNDVKELSNIIGENGISGLVQKLNTILGKTRQFSDRIILEEKEVSGNSLIYPNKIRDVKNLIKKNYAVFEVATKSLVSTGKTSEKPFINTGETLNDFLISLGRLFETGFDLHIHEIYPKVEFPVGRGTPMISPKIKWNHRSDFFVTYYHSADQKSREQSNFKIMLNNVMFNYYTGHMIDGRVLCPATGFLYLVWETLAHIHGLQVSNMKVVFENCKFKRACQISDKTQVMELAVMIELGSGKFGVIDGDAEVVSGRIHMVNEVDFIDIPFASGVPESVAPVMTAKDIYKELRIRGYHYKDKFKAVRECDISSQRAKILWEGNWTTFMDNMLQVKILQEDTRLLYVPTTIERLQVDAEKHLRYVQSFNQETVELPVKLSKCTDIIRCGGIEIQGLKASSIARRKYVASPVLEKYVFVPNVSKLTTEQAIRVNMQLLLENLYSIKVKAVELIDEATVEDSTPLGSLVHNVLADQPLIQPDIIILSKNPLEVKDVKVEDRKLLHEVDCSLVIGSKMFQRLNLLHITYGSLKPNGFILSREALDFDISSVSGNDSVSILTVFNTGSETLVLFRKKTEYNTPVVLEISAKDKDFKWLAKLKASLEQGKHVLGYAQGEPNNGLLGLVACIKREPIGAKLRLLFLPDASSNFNLELPFYKDQLEKNLVANVFKNGQWGTYRHLLFEHIKDIMVDHCFLNVLTRGDLSTLKWIEGPLKLNSKMDADRALVTIYYASLNFRDVMTASGRINVDAVTRDRREQQCVQGFEFAGRTADGRRVFGMVTTGACSTLMDADRFVLIDVPSGYSMQDVATISVVYQTSYKSLIVMGKIKKGDRVLIHSGTGGVGLAAIELALYKGCIVYTTVGTQRKRQFLKERFPSLKDDHILNSRTVEFEQHIMKLTNNQGVDVVLNSLAEDKLMASVRCLARSGRFLEIGKFDLASNNDLNLLLLQKGASFHGIMLDHFAAETPEFKKSCCQFLERGLNQGFIRPLPRTVFQMSQVEEAFRYMGSGQHIGKVMIEIRKEEPEEQIVIPDPRIYPALPRYFCDSRMSYVICGGLGGFGLELADWLVLRGCSMLVLNSRNGIKTGYQAYRIQIWESYGCIVQISTDDITTYDGCYNLLNSAKALGPVHAIFNLAVVLQDSILVNQTPESFRTSFGPKAYATEYLDQASRILCPELRDFVVFSSVSCGRGNAGQPNYGMSNSVMERICEQRQSAGLPALAIEWGAVGEVGLVAEMQSEAIEMEIGGTLQQRIESCIQEMDVLLRQNEAAVVSSIVVAEKHGSGGADNIVDAVANILGIKDIKVISLQSTLAEVGMDSMSAVEVKQTLEREFEVFLTPQDIKTMTFGRLVEIQDERNAESVSGVKNERALIGIEMVLRLMGDEVAMNIPTLSLTGRPSNSPVVPNVIVFVGLEGIIGAIEKLINNLVGNFLVVQYANKDLHESIPQIAATYLERVKPNLSKSEPFKIIGYSYGATIAMEFVKLLEEDGYHGTFIIIDSSPAYMRSLAKIMDAPTDEKLQISLIFKILSFIMPFEIISKYMEEMIKLNTFDERMELGLKILGDKAIHSPEHYRAFTVAVYKRIKAIDSWDPTFKLNSNVALLKPTIVSTNLTEDDYGISDYLANVPIVKTYQGNHMTVLENLELAQTINELFGVVEETEETVSKGDLLINIAKVTTEPTRQ